ncbi:hypothetical protein LHK_02201 [Laribacter hongkongensis HLHK9]|uniref:Uncharacterized protein n=1 Tax=Laribacter hongkongensis (strain HLHK9) TaxID=557598 RepID=C1DA70_LARHH|nr:hypothetical protein LHK_02201 [Laribacter hongkongensis HLHK9]
MPPVRQALASQFRYPRERCQRRPVVPVPHARKPDPGLWCTSRTALREPSLPCPSGAQPPCRGTAQPVIQPRGR